MPVNSAQAEAGVTPQVPGLLSLSSAMLYHRTKQIQWSEIGRKVEEFWKIFSQIVFPDIGIVA